MQTVINRSLVVVAVLMGAMTLAGVAEANILEKEAAEARSEGVVNINTATAAQLALLPGVGPTRAEAIIAARERRPFRTVNELIRVRGIGRATLRQLRPYVSVQGETTLNHAISPVRRER